MLFMFMFWALFLFMVAKTDYPGDEWHGDMVNTSIFNLHVVKHNMFVCCLAWGGQTNVGDIVWSDNTATNEAFIMAPSRL